MAQQAYLIIYGKGGHQQEMQRLLSYGLFAGSANAHIIAFTDSCVPLTHSINPNKRGLTSVLAIDKTINFSEFRDKHSTIKTLFKLPWNVIKLVYFSFLVLFKYDIKGVVSTGPGLAVIPFAIFKMVGIKTVAFESWALFYSGSLSGKLLYRLADIFFIQHESLKPYYKRAKFMGRL